MQRLTERARRIVRLAATLTEVDYTREWLLRDERGAWEKQAGEMLEKVAANPVASKMTEAGVDHEVAIYLIILANTAQIDHEEKRGT